MFTFNFSTFPIVLNFNFLIQFFCWGGFDMDLTRRVGKKDKSHGPHAFLQVKELNRVHPRTSVYHPAYVRVRPVYEPHTTHVHPAAPAYIIKIN